MIRDFVSTGKSRDDPSAMVVRGISRWIPLMRNPLTVSEVPHNSHSSVEASSNNHTNRGRQARARKHVYMYEKVQCA
jgi:hypothetical protein